MNEVTDIGETVGRIWVSPTHDRAGNMRIIPRPSDPRESYTATYDAWHRLVKLEQSDGNDGLETVAEYQYDGRNYRTLKRTYTGGVLSEARHFYYSSRWQVLEERVNDFEVAACQYVWGTRYIDDLVLRDRDTTGIGILDERFYALQDANWNVISISTAYCQIQEHYTYDAYGTLAVHNAAFTPIASSAYAWPYTYTTRRLDEETGLMYYRNRMYHPELGRFVGRDAVDSDPNVYRYCRSMPTNATDPSGLACIVKRWRREVGKQSLITADSHFQAGQDLYSMIAYYQVARFNAILKARKWSVTIPDANGYQMGQVHVQGDGKTAATKGVLTGHLFFLSADVCEDAAGDCLVDFSEDRFWTRVWNGTELSWADPHGERSSFTGHKPTVWPAAGDPPFIGDLDKEHAIHGTANKRILMGDLTVRMNSINHPELETQIFSWGANQYMRIYDTQGHSSTMNHRFSVSTATKAPYAPTFRSVGASDRIQ